MTPPLHILGARLIANRTALVIRLRPAAELMPFTIGESSLLDRLVSYWRTTTTGLHRLIWQTGTQIATGVVAPVEARDPAAARAYLVEVMRELAKVHGWPGEAVEQRAASMDRVGLPATVVTAIEQLEQFGPAREWPAAAGWYEIADQIKRAAATVSAGEAAGVARVVASDVKDAAKTVYDDGLKRVDAAQETLRSGATAAGYGLGLGAVAVLAGAALWFAAPQLLAWNAVRRRSA